MLGRCRPGLPPAAGTRCQAKAPSAANPCERSLPLPADGSSIAAQGYLFKPQQQPKFVPLSLIQLFHTNHFDPGSSWRAHPVCLSANQVGQSGYVRKVQLLDDSDLSSRSQPAPARSCRSHPEKVTPSSSSTLTRPSSSHSMLKNCMNNPCPVFGDILMHAVGNEG